MEQNSMVIRNVALFGAMITLILALAFLSGCASQEESGTIEVQSGSTQEDGASEDEQTTDSREEWPDSLVFTPIPLEDYSELTNRYEPFAEYLENVLGLPVEIFPATSYAAAVEAMRNKHTDLGYFGPFAYIHAASRANAEAFAGGVGDADGEPSYYSYFITLEDTGIETLADLEGKSFLWADPTSASGHLFPKAHMVNELGIPVDEVDHLFSEVAFSGNHEASILSVLNGDVDAAAVYDVSYHIVLRENADHPNLDKLVIFEQTKPIPLPPFTLRGDLPEDLKKAIKEAFYNAASVPELQDFLENTGHAGGYVPVSDKDFEVVRMTAQGLGMSPEDLLN